MNSPCFFFGGVGGKRRQQHLGICGGIHAVGPGSPDRCKLSNGPKLVQAISLCSDLFWLFIVRSGESAGLSALLGFGYVAVGGGGCVNSSQVGWVSTATCARGGKWTALANFVAGGKTHNP